MKRISFKWLKDLLSGLYKPSANIGPCHCPRCTESPDVFEQRLSAMRKAGL